MKKAGIILNGLAGVVFSLSIVRDLYLYTTKGQLDKFTVYNLLFIAFCVGILIMLKSCKDWLSIKLEKLTKQEEDLKANTTVTFDLNKKEDLEELKRFTDIMINKRR